MAGADGTKTRIVQCKASNGTVVADYLCIGAKPATAARCNLGPCVKYSWSAGEFGACSVKCGGKRSGIAWFSSLSRFINPMTQQTLAVNAARPYAARPCLRAWLLQAAPRHAQCNVPPPMALWWLTTCAPESSPPPLCGATLYYALFPGLLATSAIAAQAVEVSRHASYAS